MTQKSKNREKGTGSIYQQGAHFFLKFRTNGVIKTTILRSKNDKPVTSRQEAERAARILRPILLAEQKEEIALHIANAKKMNPVTSFPITQIWEKYLGQYRRPDSSESTLNNYNRILQQFIAWVQEHYPKLERANEITEAVTNSFFNFMWTQNHISGRTHNAYRQALNLIFKHIQTDAGIEKNPFEHIMKKPILTESRQAFTEDQVMGNLFFPCSTVMDRMDRICSLPIGNLFFPYIISLFYNYT